jgi:2-keto-4-pentenoate hydratase/2-oxohepta-3-ene-1,7-dioic acid hydratase in catechol pathway
MRNRMMWTIAALLVFQAPDAGAQSEKILRFQDNRGEVRYGVLQDSVIRPLKGGLLPAIGGNRITDAPALRLSDVQLLPPVAPSKVIGFGWTYPSHAREVGGEIARTEPMVFLKPPTCIIGPGDTIVGPWNLTKQLEFEGELAIIIGRKARNVRPEEALEYVLGYTCINDVTARDLTKTDPEFTRSKGFDTFGPIGPWIVTNIDPSNLRIRTRLNGESKQDARVSEMIFSLPFLISYISQVMTLNPGDVLATGTPGGTVPMKPGDVVEVEIEQIGILKNLVR